MEKQISTKSLRSVDILVIWIWGIWRLRQDLLSILGLPRQNVFENMFVSAAGPQQTPSPTSPRSPTTPPWIISRTTPRIALEPLLEPAQNHWCFHVSGDVIRSVILVFLRKVISHFRTCFISARRNKCVNCHGSVVSTLKAMFADNTSSVQATNEL